MIVVLGIGILAIAVAGLAMLLARNPPHRGTGARSVARKWRRKKSRHKEMSDLFVARLRSGAIGIPDLVRVFRKEGVDMRAVAAALAEAMSKFPQFAGKKDKFKEWITEAQREV
jgi:hypothetical protein